MAEKKKTTKKENKEELTNLDESSICKDRLCQIHGDKKVKSRGRVFTGPVVRKFRGRVSIELIRMIRVPKYERYEKRKTLLHSRLPDCMENSIQLGDLIEIAETRPISKTIHFIVTKKIKDGGKKE